jgi:hypothetical protein
MSRAELIQSIQVWGWSLAICHLAIVRRHPRWRAIVELSSAALSADSNHGNRLAKQLRKLTLPANSIKTDASRKSHEICGN